MRTQWDIVIIGAGPAGMDAGGALIGPGVFASHGYERSHKDGVLNTLRLIMAYML